jgi:hypothetical protein
LIGWWLDVSALQSFFIRIYGRWDDSPKDQNYYVKITFALISAVICGAGGDFFAGIRGLMVGLLFYILTLFILVYLLMLDPEKLGGRRQLVTDSLPSYLLLWVLLWTLLYAFTIPSSILENLNP